MLPLFILFTATLSSKLHISDYAATKARRGKTKKSCPARNPSTTVLSLNPCSTTPAPEHRVDTVAVVECNPTAMVGGLWNKYFIIIIGFQLSCFCV